LTAQNLGLEFIGIGLKNKELLIEKGAEVVYENLSEFEIKEKKTVGTIGYQQIAGIQVKSDLETNY